MIAKKDRYALKGEKNGHRNQSKTCKKCIASNRPYCARCGHTLTGDFDSHGWTVCEVCGERTWAGVGEYND